MLSSTLDLTQLCSFNDEVLSSSLHVTLNDFTFISYTDIATTVSGLLYHYFFINIRYSYPVVVELLTIATGKLMLVMVEHY